MTSQTRTNFQRLTKQYLTPRWRTLALGGLFVTLSNLCSAYYPRIIGQTVDTIAHGVASWDAIAGNIARILLLTVGSGTFMFATRKTIIVASRKIEYELRRDFLASLERKSQRFYDRMPTGVLMAHATNDIAAVREFLGPAIMYSANTFTTFIFVLALMLMLDPLVTAVALLPLPFIAFSTYRIGKHIYTASRKVQEEFSDLVRQAQEAFSGIRIIRAFVRESYEEALFSKQSTQYLRSNLRLARLQALFMPSMMLLVGSSQLLVLIIGGWRITEGTMSVGVLTQFFIYISQLIWPVAAIGWVTGIVQRSAASLDRLYMIIDEQPDIVFPNDTKTQPASYAIECTGVSFRYQPNKQVLTNITFHIKEGMHVGIVGPIGSGKSTLIRLLARLYDPELGLITIGGIPLRSFSVEDLRKIIRVVPQEPFLFSMTIAENIRVGNPTASDTDVLAALQRGGIADEVMQFPQRVDTLVGERGVLLSGGQRQRLAIARALVASPKILLLDDALSAVDTATERHIQSELRALCCTTIIVSHRISTIEQCDMVLVLENGRITAHGTHAEVYETSMFYRSLYEQQQLEQRLDVEFTSNR